MTTLISEHKYITLAEVHAPISFIYANTSARTGATGFTDLDLGKFAWQQDDDSVWMLTVNTPVWISLGGVSGAILDTDFNAHTILRAITDNTPTALTVSEQTLVGRITSGNIDALTSTQVRTLLNVEDGANVTNSTNVNAAGAVMETDYNAQTILHATVDDTPTALTVTEQTVVGRLTGGNIAAVALGIADNNIVQIDHASVSNNDYSKFTTNGIEGRSYAEVRTDLDLFIDRFEFFADMFNTPTNADWAVNALAPLASDSNNTGLSVRLFDDTTEEGVGFSLWIPTGTTSLKFTFISRPEIAPGAVRTVGLKIYERDLASTVSTWSAGTVLNDIDITTNENWLTDTQTVTLATLGVTTGQVHQFELTRVTPQAGTDLTDDWVLYLLMVECV